MSKPVKEELQPLTAEEEIEVLAWLRIQKPDDQHKLLAMARTGDSISGKQRRTFNAGRARGGIFG